MYNKLTRDEPCNTKIIAGRQIVSVTETEDMNSEIGRKLKSVEKYLQYY